ncbi:MAG TPA: ABC transporter substrate-binding protein [Solirubrobacteraceae bacterium]|jgi:peptide/nickel transport system substrate-binding protein|nr:ABC transporter substrate-binding protein [Solirubrobacteraceae bacterium]
MIRAAHGAVAALLTGALMIAAGCGGGEDVDVSGGGNDGGTGPSGAEGGGGTLVAAISAKPDRLDPHKTTAYAAFQVLENVYDTLVVPDPETLEFEPSLATEWNVSDDRLTWTFELRDGVTFHDGSTFDAADVVYSFNRIIDDELANAFRFATVKRVRAVDDDTVEIRLKQPTPNLLADIGGFKGMAILPKGAAKKYKLDTEAVGTGPFELDSTSPGSIKLTAFDDYWGDGPSLDGVEFRFVSEPTTALTGLQSGDIDWTDNIAPQRVEELSDDDSVVLKTTPSVDYWYLAANFERKPFDDPRVREAISYGIDREAITQAAKFDAATVNQTAIPEGSFWHTDYAPYEHDPDRARQLLQDAGATNLKMGLMVTDEYPETVQAAQVIAAELGDIGIDVDIQTEDFASWLDREGKGDFDTFMLGWLGNLDPFGYYHSQHHCDGANNYQGYCSKEVDRLLDEAATETDRDARKELYDEAVHQIVDDNSYIYIYNPDVVQAWSPDVHGYTIRADRAINFEAVTIED